MTRKRKRSAHAGSQAVTLGVTGAVALVIGTILGGTVRPGPAEDSDGIVLGATAAAADSDRDGIVDSWDPLNLAHDPDNDGVPNARDGDDDGDGIADKKDFTTAVVDGRTLKVDQSLSPRNDQRRYEEYVHVLGHQQADPDHDGRSVRAELEGVLRARAADRNVRLPARINALAEITSEQWQQLALPPGWHLVAFADSDNDGVLNAADRDGRPTGLHPYRGYGDRFAVAYARAVEDPTLKDVIRCLACEGTERGGGGGASLPGPGGTGRGGGGSLPAVSFFSAPSHWKGSKYHGRGGFIGAIERIFAGSAGSAAVRQELSYVGHHPEDYPSKPQFAGGEYVQYKADRAEGEQTAGGPGGAPHSGGRWSFVSGGGGGGTGGGGTGGGGGGAPPPPPGGGSHGGGGGQCSKC